jgi:hypothetical protein
MVIAGWAAWFEHSPLGEWMRASGNAYPIVNLVHLAGLILLLGPMLVLDLRLLGVARKLPLPEVSALLTPLAAGGLALLLVSGVLLFAADAGPLLDNPLFPIKLACISLGIANALSFRALWSGRLGTWDAMPPLLGRLQAAASLGLWVLAGTFGRLLAYV